MRTRKREIEDTRKFIRYVSYFVCVRVSAWHWVWKNKFDITSTSFVLFPHVNKIIENRKYFLCNAAVRKRTVFIHFNFRDLLHTLCWTDAHLFSLATQTSKHTFETRSTQHARSHTPTQGHKTENKIYWCICISLRLPPPLHARPFFLISLLNIDSYSIRNAIGIKFPLPVYIFMEHWTSSLLLTWTSERAHYIDWCWCWRCCCFNVFFFSGSSLLVCIHKQRRKKRNRNDKA